jgi:nicotinamidase-related amidase
MKIHREDTAVVFTDPQNEVLSEKGLAWPLVRESLQENNTIENMERIFKAAKAHGFEVFISPHYFYPADKGWKFNGPLGPSRQGDGARSTVAHGIKSRAHSRVGFRILL